MRSIDSIVVHCTDSPDDKDVGAREIDLWHKAQGWKCIGYHYVVRRDGRIENGRHESEVGSHAKGFNKYSLGVVWVGRDEQTKPQRESLLRVVTNLMRKHKVGINRVFGHCEINPGKSCPNISMSDFRDELVLRGGTR